MLVGIIAHPHWFWLTLGGLLLAAEMLGTSGYLLWSGLAALIVGIIEWIVPLSWTTQGSLFAVLTLVCVFLWYRWMRQREAHQPPTALNARGRQMVGLQLTLESALHNRTGHVRIGDSSWRVEAEQDLPAGTPVVVVGIEGITLRIQPR
ncbi:NfeD family protein [Pantoea sp. ARC607]|uniref:NfeD family protein n=1 Tax=unclassified Pantoea TaxID=2630326 RepID=UPI000DA99FB4|nr:NfeD family protein [Pantoea sp. ARC607]PZL97574.1 NfeD family protein [Pantoea sp. ARC607]